ncbi:MAG: sugar kinase [Halioglobus sp.]|nr:sugar kinase [Halioglobus sp.]
MVELAEVGGADLYRRGFGGDSYNTAIYLAREGLDVDYMTRLGDDAFSQAIVACLEREGIGTSLLQCIPGRQPGLYMIENSLEGERQFHYWRGQSPARELFERLPDAMPCDVFYFTGITLAITRDDIDNLKCLLQRLRQRGTGVVFDPNYRPRLWHSESQARQHYREVLPYCTAVLPTLEDDMALWGAASAAHSAEVYMSHGVEEIVVKTPQLLVCAFAGEQSCQRQAKPVAAVDTTGAGDSFNAAYLAARFRGASLEAAIIAGQNLAASVVQHRGALLPQSLETGQ